MLVKVIDPISGEIYRALLKRTNGGLKLQRTSDLNPMTEPEIYLSPGWIDFHAHVLDAFNHESLPADSIGLDTGVHMVVDAGTAGESNIKGLRKYVVPSAKTEIRAFLNICSPGLAHKLVTSDIRMIDVEHTVKAVIENKPFVCGIKVFAAGTKIGTLDTQPLKLALLAAHEAGVPVMVHIGEAPPIIDDVLNLLRSGDIVTHCFHGKIGYPWEQNGMPSQALQRALDRGVILDVAHGSASFSIEVCRRALAAGYLPNIISTDLHRRSITGVVDLATTMTKVLACGMRLEDVISAVTLAPATKLGLEDWCNLEGALGRATLFRLGSEPLKEIKYRDTKGVEVIPNKVIVPTAVISKGEWMDLPFIN